MTQRGKSLSIFADRASPGRGHAGAQADAPVLHLSGAKLREGVERLIGACEPMGGVEQLAAVLAGKQALFAETLGGGAHTSLNLDKFTQLCAFMPTCRRRLSGPLRKHGFAHFHGAISDLVDSAAQGSDADAHMARFSARFPADKTYRWVRDMAAEILHFTWPEPYPLMARWVWDTRANTGVLREIWHDPHSGDNVDHILIDVPDSHAVFLALRAELSQFLSDNGVFRDMLSYVDLLQAQIYADYINAQAGSYLRTDFSSETDPLEHVRRILGLDGAAAPGGRTRFKAAEVMSERPSDIKQLS